MTCSHDAGTPAGKMLGAPARRELPKLHGPFGPKVELGPLLALERALTAANLNRRKSRKYDGRSHCTISTPASPNMSFIHMFFRFCPLPLPPPVLLSFPAPLAGGGFQSGTSGQLIVL